MERPSTSDSQDLPSGPGSPATLTCIILGKSVYFSGPQFFHLYNERVAVEWPSLVLFQGSVMQPLERGGGEGKPSFRAVEEADFVFH